MILKKGNMFDMWGKCDGFFVTTNAFIKKDSGLVMGRGAAKQLKELIPESPFKLAAAIRRRQEHTGSPRYGLVLVDDPETYHLHGQAYGAFQVKTHFKDYANLGLIDHAAAMLADWANDPIAQQDLYVVNFPGIGNGKLERKHVLPVLERHLGDCPNVWVYEYE